MVFTSLFFIIAEKLIKKPRKYALHPLFFPKNLKSRVGRPAYTFKKNFVLRLRGANRPPGGRFGPLRIASERRVCVLCGLLQPVQPSAIDGAGRDLDTSSRPVLRHQSPSASDPVRLSISSGISRRVLRHQPPSASNPVRLSISSGISRRVLPALDCFRLSTSSGISRPVLPALDLFRHQSPSASDPVRRSGRPVIFFNRIL